MRPLDSYIKDQLNRYIAEIGKQLGGTDTIAIVTPIVPGIDIRVRDAIEINDTKQDKIAIILQTHGGIVEVVERIVEVIRNFYEEVIVIVPDIAMSAGTILALSADRIMMDYFSRLGPIDPQIDKNGKLVPALSYLKQYERLNEKAQKGGLTTVEYGLLQQLDVGDLYQFEHAREHSTELLVKWLSQYKFKDWKITESRRKRVTEDMKLKRAKEIADKLNNPERWHSHGRGISIDILGKELCLRIEDYLKNPELSKNIRGYFNLLMDYLDREKLVSFVHTEGYF